MASLARAEQWSQLGPSKALDCGFPDRLRQLLIIYSGRYFDTTSTRSVGASSKSQPMGSTMGPMISNCLSAADRRSGLAL